jgi:hypothetical protein
MNLGNGWLKNTKSNDKKVIDQVLIDVHLNLSFASFNHWGYNRRNLQEV